MTTPQPITPLRDRRLGRLVQFDERSRDYPIRSLLSVGSKPRGYTWSCLSALNQGQESSCVGFAVTHEAIARPVILQKTIDNARALYKAAQLIDQWPGENYDGTSVLAGVKVAQSLGWFEEYRWCFDLSDLELTLGYKGPVVIGINWYEGMFTPNSLGLIVPTGKVQGGHAILVNGVNPKKRLFRLHNSWGVGWGQLGDCYLSYENMDKLLHEQGEACVPIRRKKS